MSAIKTYIRFNDGTTLPTIAVHAYKDWIDGVEREILDIRMPITVDLHDIITIAESGKTDDIKLIEELYEVDAESGNEVCVKRNVFSHPDYEIVVDSGIRTIDGVTFSNLRLARLTKDERIEKSSTTNLEVQSEAIEELANIIAS